MNGNTLQHASENLKNDRNGVLVTASTNGNALQHASENLKTCQDAVLVAARNDGSVLRFASENDDPVALQTRISEQGSIMMYNIYCIDVHYCTELLPLRCGAYQLYREHNTLHLQCIFICCLMYQKCIIPGI